MDAQKFLDIEHLLALQQKPRPWPGERCSGTTPTFHPDAEGASGPNSDLARRRSETIDGWWAWFVDRLGLQAGDRVLDLGAGGVVCFSRLAEHGWT